MCASAYSSFQHDHELWRRNKYRKKILTSTEEKAILDEFWEISVDDRQLHKNVTKATPTFDVDGCQVTNIWKSYLDADGKSKRFNLDSCRKGRNGKM